MKNNDDWEDLGWIKLYRKILNSKIWCNPNGLKVWLWILLKVNYSEEPNWVGINTGSGNKPIRVYQGQFIFGRKTAAEELKMKEPTIYYWIKKLASFEYNMILYQPTKHFSIIQVNNWKQYQSILYNKPITSQYQANNTNNKYNKYNKDKKPKTLDLSPKAKETFQPDSVISAKAEIPLSVTGDTPDNLNIDDISNKFKKINPKIEWINTTDININDESLFETEDFFSDSEFIMKNKEIKIGIKDKEPEQGLF